MDKFNQLTELIDCEEVREKVTNQHYIDLMDKLAQLRGTIKKADYLVEIQTIIPELKYIGDNEYKLFEYSKYQNLVFNEKDIIKMPNWNREFDEKEFLALGDSDCNITESGQLQYRVTHKTDRLFLFHDSECDYFGEDISDDCGDCGCPKLNYKWSETKICKVEKL